MNLALHEKRYVIIGNGVAGTTAAETLRKNDPTCSIHLLTNEPYPLYNRVSLPRFLQGVITEQKVMIRDLAWHEQRNIQLVTETMVTGVHTDEHIVVTDTASMFPTMRCWWPVVVGPIPCVFLAHREPATFTTL